MNHTSNQSRLAGRLATTGLAVVLVFLAGFSIWGVYHTRHAASAAASAAGRSSQFGNASFAVAAEEGLEREYQLSSAAAARQDFDTTAAGLDRLLRAIHATGTPSDRALAATVLADHHQYESLVRRLFAAVDSGDTARVIALDELSEPRARVIESIIYTAAASHAREAQASLAALRQSESAVLAGTLAVFGIGLLLLGLCTFVLVSVRRRLDRQAAVTRHQSLHDTLTGLPNRMLLHDRAERAITSARREFGCVGLLLIDLDRFKDINDTLGHHHGDALLRHVAERLASALRDMDTVARLGGDEFAVLLPEVRDTEGAVIVAERLLEALSIPFSVDELVLEVEASIGVALSPAHGEDVDTLLQSADVAMYIAKESHSGYSVYAAELDVNSPRRLAILADLRGANARGELTLHYQPKADLASGSVRGVEALCRWNHPQLGLVPPAEFIPLAERTALIHPLTTFVLDTALRQLREWRNDGHELTMAINLSTRSLLDLSFPAEVNGMLERHRVQPSWIVFEITESTIMTGPLRALRVLRELDSLGVRIAIDDFGTGYSSLAHLKDLPVHELKIDRAFVTSMQAVHSHGVIVRSTIDLARNLGLAVVAEGVEDADVWNELIGLGCDSAQGYFLSRPVPAAELVAWLDDQGLSQHDAAA